MSVVDCTDRFAVIGAGFSGLGVMAALQRHDIAFDAFEADDEVGGNWYHGVYETVHIISSRKTTEYDDWPMPADFPDFPSKDQMLAYLRGYAEHHRLREKIAFGTAVQHLAPVGDGLWELTLPSGEVRRYGGVVVAIGHHWQKRWPSYPGAFTGEMIHSKDYKAPDRLRGKRVLVIGGGNSACDIAVEAARFAASAHISVRRGYWFMPKTMFGIPTVEFIKPWMPLWSQRLLLRGLIRVIVGKYSAYGLPEPDHPIFAHHPTINSELLYYIRHGRIAPHPDVAKWDGEWVEFADGRRERFDLVVCATGYDLGFPFLAEGVLEWDRGMPDLIDGLVSPRHKNIYFFGNSQPRYGAGPLISAGAELLCTMIAVQRSLRAPIGRLLQRLGHKPPRTWVADPIEILKNTRRGRKLLPRLAKLERWLVPEAA